MNTEKVLSYSPDDSSTKAAQSLADPKKWLHLGALDSDEGELIWGEIKGSKGDTYHTRVLVDEPSFRCSCPSRKKPCKHALALLLLRAASPASLSASPPDWIDDEPLFATTATSNIELKLPESWQNVLGEELEKPYFQKLREFLAAERTAHTIYPPAGEEFAALSATPYDEVRVFILGQDPYHGPGQAHGMAFSVRPGVTPPPSLQNIFTELKSDQGMTPPRDGFLMPWAKQGVLLLNAVLTVRRSEPNSHKSQGWEKFTDAVIRAVSDKPEPVVFVLWGAYAQKKEKLIDTSRHTVIKSVHPSPLSAHNGFWGSKPFSQVNAALKAAGRGTIAWNLNQP